MPGVFQSQLLWTAAFDDQHFQVQKNVENGRTTSQVQKLEADARLWELALMLGKSAKRR